MDLLSPASALATRRTFSFSHSSKEDEAWGAEPSEDQQVHEKQTLTIDRRKHPGVSCHETVALYTTLIPLHASKTSISYFFASPYGIFKILSKNIPN